MLVCPPMKNWTWSSGSVHKINWYQWTPTISHVNPHKIYTRIFCVNVWYEKQGTHRHDQESDYVTKRSYQAILHHEYNTTTTTVLMWDPLRGEPTPLGDFLSHIQFLLVTLIFYEKWRHIPLPWIQISIEVTCYKDMLALNENNKPHEVIFCYISVRVWWCWHRSFFCLIRILKLSKQSYFTSMLNL